MPYAIFTHTLASSVLLGKVSDGSVVMTQSRKCLFSIVNIHLLYRKSQNVERNCQFCACIFFPYSALKSFLRPYPFYVSKKYRLYLIRFAKKGFFSVLYKAKILHYLRETTIKYYMQALKQNFKFSVLSSDSLIIAIQWILFILSIENLLTDKNLVLFNININKFIYLFCEFN